MMAPLRSKLRFVSVFCFFLSTVCGFTKHWACLSRAKRHPRICHFDRSTTPFILRSCELFRWSFICLSSSSNTDDIPANLRRKISAKRPRLGHVVPKAIIRTDNNKQAGGGSTNPRLRLQGKRREAGLNNPSMLQISAGSAKGRRLDSPNNVYLRPMMAKVREAVFSTLTSFGLYDTTTTSSSTASKSTTTTRHLDMFAGSGSVGLESLSRGATHCTFVDLSHDCCSTVSRNIAWCQFDNDNKENNNNNKSTKVVCADAIQALKEPSKVGISQGSTYQIVTLCPPYEEVVYGDLLEAVANSELVTEDTIVLVEYPVELGCLPHVISRRDGGAMVGARNRRYGRTVIGIYVVNPSGRLEAASSRPEEFVKI